MAQGPLRPLQRGEPGPGHRFCAAARAAADPDPSSVPLWQQEGGAVAGTPRGEWRQLRPHPLPLCQPAGQLLLRAHRLSQTAVAGAGSALRQHQLLMLSRVRWWPAQSHCRPAMAYKKTGATGSGFFIGEITPLNWRAAPGPSWPEWSAEVPPAPLRTSRR